MSLSPTVEREVKRSEIVQYNDDRLTDHLRSHCLIARHALRLPRAEDLALDREVNLDGVIWIGKPGFDPGEVLSSPDSSFEHVAIALYRYRKPYSVEQSPHELFVCRRKRSAG